MNSLPEKSHIHPVILMSARVLSSTISSFFLSNTTSNYSYSMMYEPYCNCSYPSFNPNYENQHEISQSDSNSKPIQPIITFIDSKKKPIRRSKHIPHHLRPQHIVERRNTRERRRVQDVNQAFLILQALLPFETTNDNKDQINSTRISKVRTLRKAVDYIEALQNMLNEIK